MELKDLLYKKYNSNIVVSKLEDVPQHLIEIYKSFGGSISLNILEIIHDVESLCLVVNNEVESCKEMERFFDSNLKSDLILYFNNLLEYDLKNFLNEKCENYIKYLIKYINTIDYIIHTKPTIRRCKIQIIQSKTSRIFHQSFPES